jgi:two-component system LytT family response regulator
VRVLIVDDEDLARRALAEALSGIPDVEIAGEAANGYEAVRLAEALAPDLLFLDIQMPKLSGFEVLELLSDRVPAIFVTAHDEYALRAFDVHAVDYVLKPLDPDRLRAALERARERLGRPGPRPSARALARESRLAPHPAERVLVREEGAIHVLPAGRIDFIEARDDVVSIASGGRRYRKAERISELEALLDAARFVRVHRSFLLNVDRLARLELYAKDSWIAILRDGTKIPVSRAGRARLQKLLG